MKPLTTEEREFLRKKFLQMDLNVYLGSSGGRNYYTYSVVYSPKNINLSTFSRSLKSINHYHPLEAEELKVNRSKFFLS